MSSIAKTSISLSKKDLSRSKDTLIASRSVVFYHKAGSGEMSINLNSLVMPSEMPTQVQATAAEISGARLTLFKKNLRLVSSANGELIQGLDYIVVDSYNINLIGPYLSGGTEAAEIFVGTIVASPMSDLTVVSTQDVVKTYTLAVGQTIVNLAQEYQVGINPLDDIGAIKVWANGVLALRDQDYIEVQAGATGYGSTIQFLSSPVSVPWQIVVDFGVRAITDTNAMGTIESLSGSVLAIANDLAIVAGTSASDYLTANPSEIERRAFGNTVLQHSTDIDFIENFNINNQSLATNGYQKLLGGLIMQWGTGIAAANNIDQSVTFPIAFPTAVLSLQVTGYRSTQTTDDIGLSTSNLSKTGFQVTVNSSGSSFTPMWFAIGY